MAGAGFRVQVRVAGTREVAQRIRAAGRRSVRAYRAALMAEGERIMAESKYAYVPVDTGNLRSSGHVEPLKMVGPTTPVVELKYGGPAAPYAVIVHETPPARGNTTGIPQHVPIRRTAEHDIGDWKYLEQPLYKAMPGMAQRVAIFMKAQGFLG